MQARIGLGAAYCPSQEQLMGIDDPTDPCQSGVSSNPISTIAAMGQPDYSILALVVIAFVVISGIK